MSTLACCGPVEPVLVWRNMTSGRTHLGAYCPRCERWIKWVPQVDEWLSEAPPLEPSWGQTT